MPSVAGGEEHGHQRPFQFRVFLRALADGGSAPCTSMFSRTSLPARSLPSYFRFQSSVALTINRGVFEKISCLHPLQERAGIQK